MTDLLIFLAQVAGMLLLVLIIMTLVGGILKVLFDR